jgi:serine/threonine-protein kinase
MAPDENQAEANRSSSNKNQVNSPDPFLGELPNQYEVLGKVSEGGMGAIYKVQNRYTDGKFAIKILRPEYAHNQDVLRRFVLEAKATSALRHPHICPVHDFGISEGQMPFLVMDWIDGFSLEAKIRQDGPMPSAEAIQVFLQVSTALSHAHQNKVIHRDLKPANIMLSRNRNDDRLIVHLVDFGVAKVLGEEEDLINTQGLTKTGMVVGTPLYMSPEQGRGMPVDQRSDIYSLGCAMFFTITGKPPFVGDSFVDTIHKHMSQLPPPMDPALKVSEDLKRIVLKAMEKNPDDRYQSMEQVATDLKKLTKGVSLERKALSSEKEKRKKNLITIASFVAGFVIMYAVVLLLQGLANMVGR